MDNDSGSDGENQSGVDQEQPTPIYESVPVDENTQPEELGSDVASADEAFAPPPADIPTDQSFYSQGSNRNRYFIIGGIVLVFLIVLFVVIRLVLPGGSGKPPGPIQPVTLTYWGLWEDPVIFDELIADYKRANPNVTVTYEKKTTDEYLIRLINRTKNNTGPDMFRFHNTWLPQIQEIVSPLPTNIMSNEEFEKTFYPVHARDLKIDNYYYGIPLEIDGLVLLYNEDLIKATGITVPATWDDLIFQYSGDELKKVKNNLVDGQGNIIVSPIAIGTAENIDHFSDIWGLMLLQEFMSVAKEPAKMTRTDIWKLLLQIDSRQGINVFNGYRVLAESPTEFWNDSMPNSIEAFVKAKVAMIFVPSWQIYVIKQLNPELKFKVAKVPQPPQLNPQAKPVPVALANYWVEGVSKFSSGEKQLEAWKFLKFLSEKDNMTKLYKKQKDSRLFGEPYSRRDLAPLLEKDEYLGPVIQQAPYYYSLPLIDRTFDGGKEGKGGMNDDIVTYLKDAVNASILGADKLSTAKNGVVEQFTKYKIQ